MRRIIKKLFYITKLMFIMIPCLLLTLYVAVNCFEIIFQKDLKYISAISTFSSPDLINEIGHANDADFFNNQRFIRSIHEPKAIKFFEIGSRLEIVPAVKKDNQWLVYANKGQYVLTSENGESGIGNILVYVRKSWRTLINPEKLENGSKFTLETEEYTNLYKVVERKIKPIDEMFVANDLPKSYLILLIEDDNLESNYFIKAVFVSQEKNV